MLRGGSEKEEELTRQNRVPWASSTPSLQRLLHLPHTKGLHDDGSTTRRMSCPSNKSLLGFCGIFFWGAQRKKGHKKVFAFVRSA